MQTRAKSLFLHSFFWLALFLHLALLLSFTLILDFSFLFDKEEKEKKETPSQYTPAYISQEQIAPSPPDLLPQKNAPSPPTSKEGIEKPVATNKDSTPTIPTLRQLKATQFSRNIEAVSKKETEPVHLIGDKEIDKSLFTEIGKALTARLVYPKTAVDFMIRGTSVVGFMLYPDGHITSTQLVQSSGASVLDQAALAAVRTMMPRKVNEYLDKPKFLVIGIIFG